jgi:hypothetical protein
MSSHFITPGAYAPGEGLFGGWPLGVSLGAGPLGLFWGDFYGFWKVFLTKEISFSKILS